LIAGLIGGLLCWLIKVMNTFIETMDRLPFSVLDNIRIGFFQIICLYLIIICIALWLLKKVKKAFIGSLLALLSFGIIRYHELIASYNQKKLVVYNIPKHHAIDFVAGNKYLFKGDSLLLANEFLKNFHLKPSRIEQRIRPVNSLKSLACYDPYFHFNGKNFIILKKQLPETSPQRKILVDVIIVSGNPKITIADIIRLFVCKQVVFDASNSILNITTWKAECNQFGIPYYSVPEKGAFVMNMN
jgi:competence protein ComEC